MLPLFRRGVRRLCVFFVGVWEIGPRGGGWCGKTSIVSLLRVDKHPNIAVRFDECAWVRGGQASGKAGPFYKRGDALVFEIITFVFGKEKER